MSISVLSNISSISIIYHHYPNLENRTTPVCTWRRNLTTVKLFSWEGCSSDNLFSKEVPNFDRESQFRSGRDFSDLNSVSSFFINSFFSPNNQMGSPTLHSYRAGWKSPVETHWIQSEHRLLEFNFPKTKNFRLESLPQPNYPSIEDPNFLVF